MIDEKAEERKASGAAPLRRSVVRAAKSMSRRVVVGLRSSGWSLQRDDAHAGSSGASLKID